MKNQNFVPRSYAEMYAHYFQGSDSLALSIAKKFCRYSTDDQIEGFVHDAFERGMKGRVLEGYNPEKANFGGVVYFLVRSICVNYLRGKGRDVQSQARSLTLTVAGNEEFSCLDFTSEEEVKGSSLVEERVVAEMTVADLEEKTRALSEQGTNKRDKSLYKVVVFLKQGYTPKEVAAELGVTPTTVSNWMVYLRDMV